MDKAVREVFGDDSEERRLPFRVHLPSLRLLIVGGTVEIQPDGKVKLAPFSFARFENATDDAKATTIRSSHGLLILDRTVTGVIELSGQRALVIECPGGLRFAFAEQR